MPKSGYLHAPLSGPEIGDLRERAKTLEAVAGLWPTTGALVEDGKPRPISIGLATANLFTLLGVEPALGRLFVPEDEGARAAPRVVLGHALWRDRFGADPDVIGRTLRIDGGWGFPGGSFTVVGVAPESLLVALPPTPGCRRGSTYGSRSPVTSATCRARSPPAHPRSPATLGSTRPPPIRRCARSVVSSRSSTPAASTPGGAYVRQRFTPRRLPRCDAPRSPSWAPSRCRAGRLRERRRPAVGTARPSTPRARDPRRGGRDARAARDATPARVPAGCGRRGCAWGAGSARLGRARSRRSPAPRSRGCRRRSSACRSLAATAAVTLLAALLFGLPRRRSWCRASSRSTRCVAAGGGRTSGPGADGRDFWWRPRSRSASCSFTARSCSVDPSSSCCASISGSSREGSSRSVSRCRSESLRVAGVAHPRRARDRARARRAARRRSRRRDQPASARRRPQLGDAVRRARQHQPGGVRCRRAPGHARLPARDRRAPARLPPADRAGRRSRPAGGCGRRAVGAAHLARPFRGRRGDIGERLPSRRRVRRYLGRGGGRGRPHPPPRPRT